MNSGLQMVLKFHDPAGLSETHTHLCYQDDISVISNGLHIHIHTTAAAKTTLLASIQPGLLKKLQVSHQPGVKQHTCTCTEIV